jgi:predicted RNA-binding Zn-ribbon protein involved in translation (DUF1610 family)
MECTLCNCNIVTNSTAAPHGVKYGVEKPDGKWYCTECAEVADFASDITSVSQRKIVPSETASITVTPVKATSVVYFYCSKCKDQATGSKCEKCGNPNPMFNRNKNTKNKKKK